MVLLVFWCEMLVVRFVVFVLYGVGVTRFDFSWFIDFTIYHI